MSRFNDVREPIEYVVNQYFQKKKTINANIGEGATYTPSGGDYIDENLPQAPVYLIRDESNKLIKAIYGNLEALLDEDEEADPVIWQQELIRNEEGKLILVITTYPDGEMVENELIRNYEGRLEKYM